MVTKVLSNISKQNEIRPDWRIFRLAISLIVLVSILISGFYLGFSANDIDFANKNQSPEINAIFGYDWLGRNVFNRTISGLSISIICACVSTLLSSLLAIVFGFMQASHNRYISFFATTLSDMVCGIPQIVLLLLVSIALNRGFLGVIVGISITHWATLSKILAGEIKEISKLPWYLFAYKNYSLFKRLKLILPCIVPQILVGAGLMFPHAILHESTITFLGFGISSEVPAVGIILSEASMHLANNVWWVALLPGISLILVTMLVKYTAELIAELIIQRTEV